jgi:hypothetical protein
VVRKQWVAGFSNQELGELRIEAKTETLRDNAMTPKFELVDIADFNPCDAIHR